MPLHVIRDFSFGLCTCLHGELNIIAEVDDVVIGSGSRVSVLSQDPKIDLSICKDILPEDRREVQDSSLRFQALEGPLNVNGIDIPQEVSFING